MEPYLELKNLTKIFKVHLLGGREITGIKDVSFALNKGEFLAIMGHVGAGKSTLAKCIYRTYCPSSGDILYYLNQKCINLATAQEHEIINLRQTEIGFVSQSFKLVPRVGAVDVVVEPLVDQGIPIEKAREKAEELLRQLLISNELLDGYPSNFSAGERQRVNIARAMVSQPNLLILDEPTTSLDAMTVDVITEMLRDFKKRGVTIIGIFPEASIVRKLADKVLLLEKNRAVGFDDTETVFGKHKIK